MRPFIRHFYVFAAVLGSTVMGSTSAYADDGDFNQLLKGDYAFSQADVCIRTVPEGFDRESLELLADAEVESLQSWGVTSFDGSGNASVSGIGIGLRHGQTNAGGFPVGAPAEFTCEGSYSVAGDRSFVLNMSCTISDLGVEFGPRVLHGHISADRKTLIFADTEPVIEEIRVIGPDIVVAERVCTAIAPDAKLL